MIAPKSSKNYQSVKRSVLKTEQVYKNWNFIFYDSANTKVKAKSHVNIVQKNEVALKNYEKWQRIEEEPRLKYSERKYSKNDEKRHC